MPFEEYQIDLKTYATSACAPMVLGAQQFSATPIDLHGCEHVRVDQIVTEQAYYWTAKWQRDEAQSIEALERGDYQEFDDPDEALAWLAGEKIAD